LNAAALLLHGIAIALLGAAVPEALALHLGGEGEAIAVGRVAMFALALLAPALAAAAARRGLGPEPIAIGAAIAATLTALVLHAAGAWLLRSGSPLRADGATHLRLFLAAALLGGPPLLLAFTATLSRLPPHSGGRAGPSALLAGIAIGVAAAPYLQLRGTGLPGTVHLVAALLLAAVALRLPQRWRGPAASDVAIPPPRVACWFVLALGAGAGRGFVLVDGRLGRTELAAHAAPAILAILATCVAALAALAALDRHGARAAAIPLAIRFLPAFCLGATLGGVLPRPPGAALATLALLAGLATLLATLLPIPRRVRKVAAVAGAVLLVAAATRLPFAADSGCEPDGSHVAVARPDGPAPARTMVDGVPALPLDHDPDAVARICGQLLARLDAPRRALVLGAAAAPFASALARSVDVTWVTPLVAEAAAYGSSLGDRVAVIAANERAFVARDESSYELVVLAPPARAPRRVGRLLTAEFFTLLERRMAARGLGAQVFSLGAIEPSDVTNRLLPSIPGLAWTLELDHPENASPLLSRLFGPNVELRGDEVETLERRLAELDAAYPELAATALDARGVLACHLFDHEIFDLWFGEVYANRDEQAVVALALAPLRAPPPERRALALRDLLGRAVSPLERLLRAPGEQRRLAEIEPALRRDFEAAQALLAGAVTRASRGAYGLPEDRDLETGSIAAANATWRAASASPTLRLGMAPLERGWRDLVSRGRYDAAIIALERVQRIDPSRLDVPLMQAELYERTGHVRAAETGYRRILESAPEHGSAGVRLGFLLAGSADRARRAEALSRLAPALASGTLRGPPQRLAEILVPWLEGDVATARRRLAVLPADERRHALYSAVSAGAGDD
jgi:tetratricopeptide (TPR) repeat protein